MAILQDTHNYQDSRNNVALGMIGCAFVGVAALTAPFIAVPLRSPLPYMATPRRKVERALEFISRRLSSSSDRGASRPSVSRWPPGPTGAMEIGRRPSFVDLGSGDGTAVLAAASLGWSATGLELNPTMWLVSSARRLSSPGAVRKNSRMIWGDMFEDGVGRGRLRDADCVMVFGVRSLMPRIADLVRSECSRRPGRFLMSYRFRVPLRADMGVATEAGGDAGGICGSLIYEEEEMRIYELREVKNE